LKSGVAPIGVPWDRMAREVASPVKVPVSMTLRKLGSGVYESSARKIDLCLEYTGRQMKTIGHLGQLDELFGAPATTRSWNTILSCCGF
jgi:hypothetical protein